eukprot:TRINITY_DN1371_c0_g1_i33.p1 TRINITY_DN1371_c0_g1~~TRINITY_DN1371_c0_g1_i33.p1  ORF type:complete len:137 (+),score=34.68 TRINITY_DN1371_c0_g1_i33:306-716(+)
MFLSEVIIKSAEVSKENASAKVNPSHLKKVIEENPKYSFLSKLVADVPSVEEEKSKQKKSRTKKKRTDQDESDDDKDLEPKGKKMTKKNSKDDINLLREPLTPSDDDDDGNLDQRWVFKQSCTCLLYTSPSPRDQA